MTEADETGRLMERTLSSIWSVLTDAYRRFNAHHCPTMAAATSFYGLLSLVPLALLAVSIFGHVIGAEEAQQKVAELIREAIPGSRSSKALLDAIGAIATSQHRWFVDIIGLLGLLWSATNLLASLSVFLTQAWTGSPGGRTYLREKLVALAAIGGAGALFLLSVVFTSVVSSLSRYPEAAVLLTRLNVPMGWAAFSVVSVLMFFLLYRFLPATQVTTQAALVGAVPGAVLWHVTRQVFMVLVSRSSRYGQVYGPLAGVVIFMLWMFYSAMILFFCAEIAAVYQERRRAPRKAEPAGIAPPR